MKPSTSNARILPPGPKGHFLIGNFPLGSRDPLAAITRWAREYGDIFYYHFLHFPIYFLSHPDYIETVLVTENRKFIKGRGLEANRLLFGDGLLTSEGESWRRQRRLSQPAFHRERMASYAGIMLTHVERMLSGWSDGETQDIHQDMMQVTLAIAAEALFHADVAGLTHKVSAALNAIMRRNRRGTMLLPVVRSLPTPGHLRYLQAIRQLDDIVYGIISERRRNGHDAGDLLSLLLQAQDEDGRRMTDHQLRDEVITLLLAGHETTAVAMSWTWALLSQHPEVEGNLVAELRAVLTGRPPRVDDLPRLVYTESVLKESMRLYPPAWSVVRRAREEFEVGGYRIPAGASVIVSQWVVHRDPRFYDQPERFRPERWLDGPPHNLPKFAYFPFGGGPRICIGASFAIMEATILLATIAQRFALRLVPGQLLEPLPSITLRPRHGVQVVLHRR